jgi:hypothetical protein
VSDALVFREGSIEGLVILPSARHSDTRGWLDEIRHEDDPRSPFVRDELSKWEHRQ